MAVLEWAAASGVVLPEAELERYGRARLDPGAPEPEPPGICRSYPAVLRGLLDRLAAEPPEVTEAAAARPGRRPAQPRRPGRAPGADRTVAASSRWRAATVEPLGAFDEIVDVRAGRSARPGSTRRCCACCGRAAARRTSITELLGALTGPDPRRTSWTGSRARSAAVPARGTTNGGWLRLAQALAGHPILEMLPEAARPAVRNAVRILPLLDRARWPARRATWRSSRAVRRVR